eukprot:SAG22_NODE_14689_length_368_cov_0.524164_1_plen_100_part_10
MAVLCIYDAWAGWRCTAAHELLFTRSVRCLLQMMMQMCAMINSTQSRTSIGMTMRAAHSFVDRGHITTSHRNGDGVVTHSYGTSNDCRWQLSCSISTSSC